jgi:hypothetical protein
MEFATCSQIAGDVLDRHKDQQRFSIFGNNPARIEQYLAFTDGARSHAFAHFIDEAEPPRRQLPNLCIIAPIYALYSLDGRVKIEIGDEICKH